MCRHVSFQRAGVAPERNGRGGARAAVSGRVGWWCGGGVFGSMWFRTGKGGWIGKPEGGSRGVGHPRGAGTAANPQRSHAWCMRRRSWRRLHGPARQLACLPGRQQNGTRRGKCRPAARRASGCRPGSQGHGLGHRRRRRQLFGVASWRAAGGGLAGGAGGGQRRAAQREHPGVPSSGCHPGGLVASNGVGGGGHGWGGGGHGAGLARAGGVC